MPTPQLNTMINTDLVSFTAFRRLARSLNMTFIVPVNSSLPDLSRLLKHSIYVSALTSTSSLTCFASSGIGKLSKSTIFLKPFFIIPTQLSSSSTHSPAFPPNNTLSQLLSSSWKHPMGRMQYNPGIPISR